MPRSFVKDPAARKDYEFDWADWLRGDTIVDHLVTADEGLTVADSSQTATAVTVWLSGGVLGQTAAVTCHIKTAAGRELDGTIVVTVGEQ